MGQPLLACTWILAATQRLWAGPAPYLLNLRNPVLVAEELAWTHARFPGRVAAALAPGYAQSDFDLVGVTTDDRADRFTAALRRLLAVLAGEDEAAAGDAAIAHWIADPAPILRAANTKAGVRRAAEDGLGVLFPGGEARERMRAMIDAYHEAGGSGPVVKIRQIWMGTPPPGALERRDAVYRAAAAKGSRQATGFAEPFLHGDDDHVAEELCTDIAELGLSGMNLRFHLDGIDHATVLDQLARFGDAVLPRLDFPAVAAAP
jgi:alkanesulfonate monooxygenase SsuD/methylene tetrahydromethanopterin reductase-like flavin-dependent oxidoreductase (luciferase family)